MTDVACQKCGVIIAHRDAVFLGPPFDVTWLCRTCDAKYERVHTHTTIDPTHGSYRRSPVPVSPPTVAMPPPVGTELPAHLVTATSGDHSHPTASADDIHRLRFELAHIIRYFDQHEVPEELVDWHFKAKLLIGETNYARPTDNTGKPWTVEE